MGKFKVGDIVAIIKSAFSDEIKGLHNGDIGVIKSIYDNERIYDVYFPGICNTVKMTKSQLKKCECPSPDNPQEIKFPSIGADFSNCLSGYVKINSDSIKINSDSININVEKEKNNMEILDLYRKRKNFKIENDFLINQDKILEEDEIQKIFKEMIEQVNVILENEGSKPVDMELPIQYREFHTAKTNEKLNKLEADRDRLLDKVYSDYEEVKALLSMTNDYQEQIKILKNYGIIDKKTNKLSV